MPGPYSLQFDGSTGYVQFGSGIAPNTAFTISLWFYINALPGSGSAASLFGSDGAVPYLLILPDGSYRIQIGSRTFVTGSSTLSVGVWYNYILTFDGTNCVGYLDGTQDLTLNSTTAMASGNWYLGSYNTTQFFFNGNICGLRTFNSALGSTAINTLAAGNEPGGELDHYDFHEGSGTTLHDVAGSINGTLVNGPPGTGVTWSTSIPLPQNPDPLPGTPAISLLSSTIRAGNSTTATISWKNGIAPGSSTSITLTANAGGTFAPGTVTGTTSGSWSTTSTLTIAGGTSAQAGIATATDSITSGQAAFSVVVSQMKIALSGSPLTGSCISPKAQLLIMRVESIAGSTPYSVTAVGTGATYRVNGGSPIALTDPTHWINGPENYAVCTLRPPPEWQFVDSAAAVLVGPGWVQVQTADITPGEGNGAQWYGGKLYATTGATDTATYSATVSGPGRFRIAFVLDAKTQSAKLSARTTNAQFVVKDGSGSTLGTFNVDQTAHGVWNTDVVSLADVDLKLHLTVLGWVDLASGDTITCEASNAAGGGSQLVLSAMHVMNDPLPTCVPGDNVVVTLPDAFFTTSLDTTGAQTVTVPVLTEPEWFPADLTQATKVKVGYNGGEGGYSDPWVPFANRMLGSFMRAIPGNLSATGEMSSNTTSGAAKWHITAPYLYNAIDDLGLPVEVNLGIGNWNLRYQTGGNPAFTIFDFNGQNVSGSTSGPSGGGGSFTQQFAITWPFVGSLNGAFIDLVCTAQGSTADYATNIVLFDNVTPANWTKTTHPVTYSRLANRGFGFLRWMTQDGVKSSNRVEFADFAQLAYDGYQTTYPVTLSATITQFAPVDFAGNSDSVNNWLAGTNGYGQTYVRATLAPPNGLTAASLTAHVSGGAVTSVTINSGGSGYPWVPALIFTGSGSANGAQAVATVTGGVITAVRVTNGGTGYTGAPTVVAAQHPFRSLQLPVVTGATLNGPTPLANVGPTPSAAAGNGFIFSASQLPNQYLFLVDATTIILPCFSNGGLIGPTPTSGAYTVSGTTSVSGTVTVTVPLAAPDLPKVQVVNECGMDYYWNGDQLESDDSLIQRTQLYAANLRTGARLGYEYSNETWNSFGDEYHRLLYQTNYDAAFNGSIGGSPFFYAKESLRRFNVVKTAWVGAGRSAADLVYILGGQRGNPGATTADYISYLQSVGSPTVGQPYTTAFAADGYIDNTSETGSSPDTDGPGFFDRLTPDGLCELQAIFIPSNVAPLAGAYADIQAYDTHAKLINYESGYQFLCNTGTNATRNQARTAQAQCCPSNYWLTQFLLDQFRQAGVSETVRFTLTASGGFKVFGQSASAAWWSFQTPASFTVSNAAAGVDVGTGNAGENPATANQFQSVSQEGGAERDWASRTPTPTPTPVLPPIPSCITQSTRMMVVY